MEILHLGLKRVALPVADMGFAHSRSGNNPDGYDLRRSGTTFWYRYSRLDFVAFTAIPSLTSNQFIELQFHTGSPVMPAFQYTRLAMGKNVGFRPTIQVEFGPPWQKFKRSLCKITSLFTLEHVVKLVLQFMKIQDI